MITNAMEPLLRPLALASFYELQIHEISAVFMKPEYDTRILY